MMTASYRDDLRRRKAEMDAEARAPKQPDAHVVLWRNTRRLAKLMAARAEVPKLREIVEVETEGPVFRVEMRPNPSMTRELLEAIDSGELHLERDAGAAVNLSSLIGGLARIGERTHAHELAAARYRSIREGAMIGAAQGTDYAQPRVDTSMKAATSAGDAGCDDRAAYYAAYMLVVRKLGKLASNLLDKVVGEGRSLREVALKFGYGDGYRPRQVLQRQLLAALDMLVEHFKVAGAGYGVVGDGLRPENASTDVVIRRKACEAA